MTISDPQACSSSGARRRSCPWSTTRRGESFVFAPAATLRATQCQATARAAYQKKRYGRVFVVRTATEAGQRVVRLRRVS